MEEQKEKKKPNGGEAPANSKNGAGIARKKKLVLNLEEKIKKSKTVLIASIKNLPSSQYQDIKKKLRGKAEIIVIKKSLVLRAMDKVEKGALKNLKEKIGADVAVFFSELDAFSLSGLLSENVSPAKAKPGDLAPEDIVVEPGPTELIPGPAISELSSVGLKVAVEGGKIAIKKGATIVKKGEKIGLAQASVMGKVGIEPMKVGFEPIAAYDSNDDKTYFEIKIDKKGTLEGLREAIGKAFSFGIGIGFVSKETVGYYIARAGLEEKALAKLVEEKAGKEEISNDKDSVGGAGDEGESKEEQDDKTPPSGGEEEKVEEAKAAGDKDEKKEEASEASGGKGEGKNDEVENKESVKKEENSDDKQEKKDD
jgi:large subunit ribosomal protein L10